MERALTTFNSALIKYCICIAAVLVCFVQIESKMQYQSKTMESQSLCGPGPVGQTLSSRQIQNVRSLLKNE